MDGELKNLKFNINQLAGMTELHRQTVANRLKDVPLAPGSNQKNKLYLLTDVIKILMTQPMSEAGGHQDPNKMTPKERKDWFDSEKGRIWLEKELRHLIPHNEVISVYSSVAKSALQVLETLPDRLERDAALSPAAVLVTQTIIDSVRDDLALKTYQECAIAQNFIESSEESEGEK